MLKALKNGKLKNKQIAIFMPSVELSKDLHAYLNKNGVMNGHIDGTTKEREEIQEDFEQKYIQVICSCDALKSSWDSDIIDGVIILKPTLSPAVYMQMVGRALHGKMLDANGNKVPKDEIIVCDIVNDQNEIATRHITTRGLSTLIQLTRKKDRETISINKSEYISEILFYYDVENIFSLE
ncbi:MAG TPA: helicase-related protein [Ignavibacteriaceae bacterium]